MTVHSMQDSDITPPRPTRPSKSRAAFRTISEVADELDVAQHVLRFWESKFPQVRPLKRGGGRRYYRPEDVDLLREIRALLYDEGYTIKGAEKLLRQRRTKQTAEKPKEKAAESSGQLDMHEKAPAQAETAASPQATPAITNEPDKAHQGELMRIRDRLISLKSQLDVLAT